MVAVGSTAACGGQRADPCSILNIHLRELLFYPLRWIRVRRSDKGCVHALFLAELVFGGVGPLSGWTSMIPLARITPATSTSP